MGASWKDGDIIAIDGNTVLGRVEQVVDKDNAIISLKKIHSVNPKSGAPIFLDAGEFWMNVPTTGMVDDTGIKDHLLLEIDGTKQYNTAGGSTRTLRVLKIATLKGFRQWTYKVNNKERKLLAKYVERNPNWVKVELPAGKKQTLSYRYLSREDKEWLAEEAKKPRLVQVK